MPMAVRRWGSNHDWRFNLGCSLSVTPGSATLTCSSPNGAADGHWWGRCALVDWGKYAGDFGECGQYLLGDLDG